MTRPRLDAEESQLRVPDAAAGTPVWRRSVGVHNGHDTDNLLAEKGNFSKLHIPEPSSRATSAVSTPTS